jgi:hypothetical protein
MVHLSLRFSFPSLSVSQGSRIYVYQSQLIQQFRIQNRLHISLSIVHRKGYENYGYEICMLIMLSNNVSLKAGDETHGAAGSIIDVSATRMCRFNFIPTAHRV